MNRIERISGDSGNVTCGAHTLVKHKMDIIIIQFKLLISNHHY